MEKFEGFSRPTKNYFHMPNNWTDITADINSIAELKIVEYILRHTWGYQEYGEAKTITVDEFMYGRLKADGSRMDKGTGLKSDRSVKDGIKLAEQHGYIICDFDRSDLARIKKSYKLRMSLPDSEHPEGYFPPPEQSRGVESTCQRGTFHPSGVQNLPLKKVESTPRSEKDTVERYSKKDTVERQTTGSGQTRLPVVGKPDYPPQNQPTNPSITLSDFSPEEKNVFDLYCRVEIRPPVSEKVKKQCYELAPHIQTLEDMKSLHKHAQEALGNAPNKRIFLGNLTGALPAWLEKRKPPEVKKKSKEEHEAEALAKFNRIRQANNERMEAERKMMEENSRKKVAV